MLFNATLLRIDDAPPGEPGADVNVRCSTGALTSSESASLASLGIEGTAVLYLPIADAEQVGTPTVGQRVVVRTDGMSPMTYAVVHVVARVGVVLRYLQVFLGPVDA